MRAKIPIKKRKKMGDMEGAKIVVAKAICEIKNSMFVNSSPQPRAPFDAAISSSSNQIR
jgi:hypothetical protein